jgi:hypothetical protein
LAGLVIVTQIAEEKPASGFFFHFDCKDFSVYERRGKNGGSSSNKRGINFNLLIAPNIINYVTHKTLNTNIAQVLNLRQRAQDHYKK